MKESVSMSVEHAILEAVRALPVEKQQEILSYATRLRRSLGRPRDLAFGGRIEENQREMWNNFPREDI